VGFQAAKTLLSIAEHVLEGEMLAKAGDYPGALAHLDRAVRVEDSLLYNEPPDWYFPVRHILGAILLEAGRPAEAEVVYWEDLRRNPANGYALFGLKQSLEAQDKRGDLPEVDRRLAAAWSEADVSLSSSRY
jgi:tetratricopeptide (TPR) repeat protein